ncbi:AcrR family transcriptional regulator [Streptosporangium album]|uniref:AcrR family transcriptional regulator n=1 Tax=Streptosporangium album TaxID=47479 RepID=A0A7W7WDV9_9ACTN|nr:TetR/AcrR family transcriptional regulator [Streptosporangium album]MBB4943273.1 AcrR family transcriptional regulator [Streptosporangium album]
MSKESTRKRRRGTELEAALLEAAWDELVAVGYEQLTYEAVADRAGTSRPVLYRRWPSKRELVLAALRHQAPSLPDEPPDTGDLRGDVLALLRLVVRRTRELAPVREVLAAEQGQATELTAYLASRNQGPGHDWMRTVLERAARRGEVDAADPLPDRLVTLPVVLVVHDLFTARRIPTDADLEEIVDRLFLPLVMHRRGQHT